MYVDYESAEGLAGSQISQNWGFTDLSPFTNSLFILLNKIIIQMCSRQVNMSGAHFSFHSICKTLVYLILFGQCVNKTSMLELPNWVIYERQREYNITRSCRWSLLKFRFVILYLYVCSFYAWTVSFFLKVSFRYCILGFEGVAIMRPCQFVPA